MSEIEGYAIIKMMKKAVLIIVIFFCIILAGLAGTSSYEKTAFAAELDSVIVTTKGVMTDTYEAYTGGKYGRDVKLTVITAEPRVRFKIYKNITGLKYEEISTLYLVYPKDGTAEFVVPVSGDLIVRIEPQNSSGQVVGAYKDIEIKNDSAAPMAPNLKPDGDYDVFEIYYNSPFNFEFSLKADEDSGIDYNRSRYYYKTFQNEVIKTGVFKINSAGEIAYIGPIDSNGILWFELYDQAGNKAEYTYAYTKYGFGESAVPVITLSTEEYAKSVTVTISWGADYDASNSPKEYSITTLTESKIYDYTKPFVVNSEGDIKLKVFYYQNGEKKFVERIINNVDKSAPSLDIMNGTISYYCDLTADLPIYVSIRAVDSISGIKRVYSATKEFINISGDIYILDITGLTGATIFLEDKAGNVVSKYFSFSNYDYATITKYNNIFKELDRDEYDIDGWARLINAFYSLSVNLAGGNSADYNTKYAVDKAIEGKVEITTVINEIPSGLSGVFNLDIEDFSTSIKKGGKGTVTLSKPNITNDELNSNINTAKQYSGMSNGEVFALNLNLISHGESVSILEKVKLSIALPSNTQLAKLLLKTENGFILIDSEIKNGYIVADIDTLGDFYLICVRTAQNNKNGIVIGNKLYTYADLGVTAGIIAGVIVIGIVVVLILNKRKKD